MNDKLRQAKLRSLMTRHALDAKAVAAMTYTKPQTVRAWRCGSRKTPAYALALIELRTGRR